MLCMQRIIEQDNNMHTNTKLLVNRNSTRKVSRAAVPFERIRTDPSSTESIVEYHCTLCNTYKQASQFYKSCIARKARYCKPCFTSKTKRQPQMQQPPIFFTAKQALARLRRYCLRTAKTCGRRHVMFNAYTAVKVLNYWKDMLPLPLPSDSEPCPEITFVIWDTKNAEIVEAHEVVPFLKEDGWKIQSIPPVIRDAVLKSDARDAIKTKLAGAESYINTY